MEFVRTLFDTSDFPARWHCGNWTQSLGWLHIISDLLIFAAYFAIPCALAVIAFRRRDFPFTTLLLLFVSFILACGSTHLVEAIIFWKPIYRFAGLLKAITAIISLTTAVVLIRALPSFFSLPGLQRIIDDLRAALSREEHTRQELANVRDTLERRSSDMTLRLRRAAASLASARAVACRWQAESGLIDWEIGYAESCRQAGISPPPRFHTFADLLTPADGVRLQQCVDLALATNQAIDFEGALATGDGRLLRLGATLEPRVADQPAFMTGMFRFL